MNRHFALIAFLVLLGAGWGLTGVLAKFAVDGGYQHFGIIFWQLAIGTLVLGALTFARGKTLSRRPRHLGLYLFIALCGTILPNATGYVALAHLPAGVMAIAIAAVPMFAFPIALVMGNERFSLMRLSGLLVGLIGVAFLIGPEKSLAPGLAIWVPLALVAPFLYGIEGNVVAKFGTYGLDPVQTLFGASFLGMFIALPLALATDSFIDPRGPWGVADLGVIGSSVIHAFVYSGYVWLVGRAGPSFAAQASYLVTGSGVIWAMVLLDESYSLWVWAALGIMFVALFLVQPRESRLPDSAPPA